MKALVYTRVSTQGQKEGYSLETQKEACLKKAEELGAKEIIYLEDTYTGIEIERPALASLRELALKKAIDLIVIYDPDRLSRNLFDLLLLTSEIDKCQVKLVFVNFSWESTPLGKLFLELRGAIAEFEHALIRERTLRGKRKKAENGRLPGFVKPYGYCFDKETDSLRIVEYEAKMVEYIFTEYLKGFDSGMSLAKKLNQKQIKAPLGKNWHASTVLRILSNPTYLGVLDIGSISVAVPQIIQKEVFLKAQKQKESNKKTAKRKTKNEYLLQNLLYCHLCGAKIKVNSHYVRGKCYSYYICSWQRLKKCQIRPYSTVKLDNLIWKEFVFHFEKRLPEYISYVKKIQQDNLQAEFTKREKALQDLKSKEKRILGYLLSGIIKYNIYREEQQNVEIEIENLNKELAALSKMSGTEVVRENPILNNKYKKQILELFVDKVELASDEVLIWALF